MATDLQVLTAMGNDTRYELLRRIANADDGVCVCDLEAAVGVSQSAVSQALSRLYTAELVTRRARKGLGDTMNRLRRPRLSSKHSTTCEVPHE